MNGWQRLWLVVVVLWGVLVGTWAVMLWPRTIYHPPNGYSEEVVSAMRIKDWKGKSDCAGAPSGNVPLQVVPDDPTVAYVVRLAYPNSYDDLTDQQLEEALRSKAPELDRIVRKMIAAHESLDDTVFVVRNATLAHVKGVEDFQPLFARVEIEMKAGKDNPFLCFAGERPDRASQIVKDYADTSSRLLKSEQHQIAGLAAAFWLIPSAFIYALGWSVGWIRRGFGKSGSAQ